MWFVRWVQGVILIADIKHLIPSKQGSKGGSEQNDLFNWFSLSVIFEPFSQSCCVILERIGKDPKDIKKYYNSSVFGPSSCETLIPYALVIGENS